MIDSVGKNNQIFVILNCFFVDKSASESFSKKAEVCKFLKFYAFSDENKKNGRTVIRDKSTPTERHLFEFSL